MTRAVITYRGVTFGDEGIQLVLFDGRSELRVGIPKLEALEAANGLMNAVVAGLRDKVGESYLRAYDVGYDDGLIAAQMAADVEIQETAS